VNILDTKFAGTSIFTTL